MDVDKDFPYFKYNEILLRFAALTKLKSSANFIQTFLYYTWRIIGFTLGFSFVAIVNDTVQNSYKDFGESVFNYVYLGSLCFTFTRTCYYYYSDDRTENFINDMKKTFKYESKIGFEETSMARVVYVTKWMSIIWFCITILIGNIFFVIPFFFGYYSKKMLPVPGWYSYNFKVSPYYEFTVLLNQMPPHANNAENSCTKTAGTWMVPHDWSSTPYYEMTVFVQLFDQTAMIFLTPTSDSFYISMCTMVAKQFEILVIDTGWEIKNLIYSNMLRNGISKEIVVKFKDEMRLHHHKESVIFRTSRPVMLTVGKFAKLVVNMFTWTVKVSYSFTAVVRNMNRRD